MFTVAEVKTVEKIVRQYDVENLVEEQQTGTWIPKKGLEEEHEICQEILGKCDAWLENVK